MESKTHVQTASWKESSAILNFTLLKCRSPWLWRHTRCEGDACISHCVENAHLATGRGGCSRGWMQLRQGFFLHVTSARSQHQLHCNLWPLSLFLTSYTMPSCQVAMFQAKWMHLTCESWSKGVYHVLQRYTLTYNTENQCRSLLHSLGSVAWLLWGEQVGFQNGLQAGHVTYTPKVRQVLTHYVPK